MAKDNDMKDLSEQIDKIVEDVNARVDEAVKKIDEKVEQMTGIKLKKSRKAWDNTFWGAVLILIGFFWLGNNLDWFSIHIPFWPVVLIVIGLYLLLDHRRHS